MIEGEVNARLEAMVRVEVRGPEDSTFVDAIVDSGFSAALTLPATSIAALKLSRLSEAKGTLADGSVAELGVYAAELSWEGRWRGVLVHAAGDEVLLGMGLLKDHRLTIDVTEGGDVQIAPLSATT